MDKLISLVFLLLCNVVQAAEFGSVEGDMYLVTQSGEVKQGAANQVYLIPQKQNYSNLYTELCDQQKEASSSIQAENNRLGEEFKSRIDNATGSSQQQQLRSEFIEHLEFSLNSLTSIIRIQAEERSTWIRLLAVNSLSTGMRAHYSLETEAGDYLLFAEMQLGNNSNRWLVPISVTTGNSLTVDLDNNNLIPSGKFNCDSQLFTD